MEKQIKTVGMLFFLWVGIFFFGQHVKASTVQRETGDYVVEYLSPAEQVKAEPYYDVRYQPGTTHDIQARITNLKSKTIKVHQKIKSTITNGNGTFGATTNTKLLDPSMRYPLSEISKLDNGDEVITLAPFQSKTITAHITAPKKDFSGVIHGEWSFVVYSKVVTGVGSNYAYSLGIQLRGSTMNEAPKLVYKDTKPMEVSGFPVMGIGIRNVNAMYLDNVTVKASILRKGFLKSKHDKYQTGVRIAPNSLYRIPIEWNYDRLKAGNYEVDVQMTGINHYNSLAEQWHFKKSFTIKENEVKLINEQSIKKPLSQAAYVAATSGVILIILLGGLFYVKRYI